MERANWPDPSFGFDPNQDIFQSRCSWKSFSSSRVKCKSAAMALVRFLACKTIMNNLTLMHKS